MSGIKEGDLITVTQAVAETYLATKDIKAVSVKNSDLMEELGGNIRTLRGKSLFFIEHHDCHSKLRDFGVNIGHFTLRSEPIESVSLENPDYLLINGEVKIYDEPRGESTLTEKPFTDESIAQSVATALNKIERDKFKELKGLVEEGLNMMDTIVEKGRV